MGTIWFCFVAFMIVMYVLLDGFDLGTGSIYLLVARTDPERREVLASIGPIWNGNEVLLIAAGGTLFFAFPFLYASSFSGFYLPLMIVLWLLILRGTSVEFRNEMNNAVWNPFWDLLISLSSLLLVIFFGVALGNVVRGVPLDVTGYFFEPLWTDFGFGHAAGILDWYTVLVGLLALASLALHGGLWLQMKTKGAVQARARAISGYAWWVMVVLVIVVTAATFTVQGSILSNFKLRPWGFLFPMLAIAGAAGVKHALTNQREVRAFVFSMMHLAGMLACVVFGIYPMVLPGRNPAYSLTIQSTQTSAYGLTVALIWWTIGMVLAGGYLAFSYRSFAGRVTVEQDTHR